MKNKEKIYLIIGGLLIISIMFLDITKKIALINLPDRINPITITITICTGAALLILGLVSLFHYRNAKAVYEKLPNLKEKISFPYFKYASLIVLLFALSHAVVNFTWLLLLKIKEII